MTLQELIEWCDANGVSRDTHIALRAKDDYILTLDGVSTSVAYFGNCSEGMAWENENAPRDEDGEIDYDNMPEVLILDSFSG